MVNMKVLLCCLPLFQSQIPHIVLPELVLQLSLVSILAADLYACFTFAYSKYKVLFSLAGKLTNL